MQIPSELKSRTETTAVFILWPNAPTTTGSVASSGHGATQRRLACKAACDALCLPAVRHNVQWTTAAAAAGRDTRRV